jgi:hypothetical protein
VFPSGRAALDCKDTLRFGERIGSVS